MSMVVDSLTLEHALAHLHTMLGPRPSEEQWRLAMAFYWRSTLGLAAAREQAAARLRLEMGTGG